jgi:RNA polymerase sigma factor (sigma-70 family)
MRNNKSVTPEGPTDEVEKPPDPSKELFDKFYKEYESKLEGYAFRHLPTEIAEDVLSKFWLAVWKTIRTPGKFVDMGKTRGWLYRVLKNTIAEYYRNQPKITKLIVGSLDDEAAVNSIEASFGKQQNDLIRRYSLRELFLATGEQCLTNEKHRLILCRDLEGEEEPPEGWTPKQVYDNRHRMLEKLKNPIKKALGKT